MTENPLISVIVPIYKVEAYLHECVDSILCQTYRNLEIILVDDGSPDGCGSICDEYAAKDGRVKVIHKANGGVSSARNAGLAAVTGALIAFVDGDDYVAPNLYERLYGVMAGDPRLDVVYTACVRVPSADNRLHMDFYPTGTVITGEEMAQGILMDRITSHMWLGLFKRFCWQGIVFPEGRTYEDVAMTFRAFDKVRYVGFVMEPLYFYRINDTSITQTVKPQKIYDIFKAYQCRYEQLGDRFPELANRTCARCGHYAISLYFHYCAGEFTDGRVLSEVTGFLKAHRKEIRAGWGNIPRSRRLALRVYYLCPPLLRLGTWLLHVTGLQKKLGYQLK